MRISGIRKIITVILLCGILLSLNGCHWFLPMIENEGSEINTTSDISKDQTSTEYNARKIVVSEAEQIILIEHTLDLGVRTFDGYGEWICGENSEFVIFNYAGIIPGRDSEITGGLGVFKADPHEIFLMEYTQSMSDYYAFNKNGVFDICFGVNGKTWISFAESEKANIFVTVEYLMRDQTEDWSYTPVEWKNFKNSGGQYRCEEMTFWYDATTNIGKWSANGIEIPIRIEFLSALPAIKIYDVGNQKEILYASGIMENDSTLILNTFYGDMFYENTIQRLIIKKQ